MTSSNIPELRFRNGGIMRFKGSILGQAYFLGHHHSARQRGLLVAYSTVDQEQLIDAKDSARGGTSGFLRIPSKIPDILLWKGSRERELPPHGWPYVDADAEDRVDVDKWSWQDVGIHLASDESEHMYLFRSICGRLNSIAAIAQFHPTKIHSILYLITSHGNAFLIFPTSGTGDQQEGEKADNACDFWTSVQVFDCTGGVQQQNFEEEMATSVDLNTSFGLCSVGTSK